MARAARAWWALHLKAGALLTAVALLAGACGGGSGSTGGAAGSTRSFPFEDENGFDFRVSLQVPAQIVTSHGASVAPTGQAFVVVPFTLRNVGTRSALPETLFLGRVIMKTSAPGATTACLSTSTVSGYCTLGPVTIEYPDGSQTELAPNTNLAGELVVDAPSGTVPADLAFLPVASTAAAGIPSAYGSVISLG